MIEPRRYRKKPVVIEAVQLTVGNTHAVAAWCNGYSKGSDVIISTLEGEMIGHPGDYVIKGVEGEFYPCMENIFLSTYEPEDQRVKRAAAWLTKRFNDIE